MWLVARVGTITSIVAVVSFGCGDGFTSGEGGGGDTTTATTTSSGQGGNVTAETGCADGTRELFVNLSATPNIAGCRGGFQVAGVTTSQSKAPQCNRDAGNDSGQPNGEGCSVADLCAAGWHVCDSLQEVTEAMQGNSCPTTPDVSFWITRISTTQGTLNCVDGGNDNLVGCGFQVGQTPNGACGSLNAVLLTTTCDDELTAWDCGEAGETEAEVVVKAKAAEGGVLCCRG